MFTTVSYWLTTGIPQDAHREIPHSPVGFRFFMSGCFDIGKTAYTSVSLWTMNKAVGFWKPGEAEPTPNDVVGRDGDHGGNNEVNGGTPCLARTKDHRRQESRGEPMDGSKKRDSYHTGRQISAGGHRTSGKKGKGKELKRHKSLEQTNSFGQKGKMGLCGGPSQELLAMKFMQRRAKVEDARQERDRKAKLDRDFSNPYAKRLKTDTIKDRLVCRIDEQDPALVVLGRRSFGGFNVMAEAAYDACIKEIGSGARFILENAESDSGVSDTEMADRLGKSVRQGER